MVMIGTPKQYYKDEKYEDEKEQKNEFDEAKKDMDYMKY